MGRVILAMSGGVDSSVAAHLLLQQGHEVIGVFMRHGQQAPITCGQDLASKREPTPLLSQATTHKQGCCSAEDAEDARRVADQLNIPFYAIDFQEEFDRIITYFVDEYTVGRTPNPCIVCNQWLKFGKLFQYADSVGAAQVATGHYARKKQSADGKTWLYRGIDPDKDQCYVLFGIAPDRLPRVLLPLGEYRKTEIRQMATQLGLRVADKRDSQEICFAAPGQHAQLVRDRRPNLDTSGPIVTVDGRVVGHHDGIERFTIGQRKGLGVAMGEPYFVVRIDATTGQVVIGPRSALHRQTLTASDVNWFDNRIKARFRCLAKIRYNTPATPSLAEHLPGNRLRVTFDAPCFGIAPGQAVVCFDGDRLLGGGWID